MLRKIRIALAVVSMTLITLLLLDVSGALHAWLGWLANIQLLPAVLAGNFVVVAVLLLVTFLFGRVYCSVVCPLGIMQDLFSHFGGKVKKNRFEYKKNHWVLRVAVLVVFAVLMVAGVNALAILIAPYSAYGRIATQLLKPVWVAGNNLLALIAEHYGSYAFYHVDVWVKSGVTLLVAAVTFVVLAVWSWKSGRAWCNNICPVGTVLGLVSSRSLFCPQIDEEKCVGCGKCARNCKACCIEPKKHEIDGSRCVACMDCLDNCKQGAITYKRRTSKKTEAVNEERRKFLTTTVAVGAAMAVEAQEMKVDGGLAVIEDKQVPKRNTPLKPAGSKSLKHFGKHCTACQLCVSACPNHVLRPSKGLSTLMQPEMNYEQGYCRADCTKCSEVCPANAIAPVTKEEKTDIKIGRAVWVRENCLMPTGKSCGKCQQGCPAGAILLVDDLATGHKVPSVNESRCIGCGKCEYLCPVRPFSAIYVEGYEVHQ